MKQILKILSFIEITLGIIGSFLFAIDFGVSISEFGTKHRDWVLTLTIFICVLFCSFINFVILYAIYEILDNQETIYNTLNPAPPQILPESTPNKWKCPECGRYNDNYVGTCGCGYHK